MNIFNFLYIKTPKTASELIKRYLRQYGDDAGLKRNSNPLSKFFENKKFEYSAEHIMMTPKVIKHFYSSNNKNYSSLILTSIREPLDRMVSHYYFSNLNRNQMTFDEWYYDYHHGTLKKLKFGWKPYDSMGDREPAHFDIDDYQLNYIGVHNPTDVFQLYDFIFVSEKVEEQVTLLEKVLDFKIQRYEGEKHINHNKNYPDVIEVSREIKDLFRERNQRDYELYDFVNQTYFGE
jgi:hypothetical protein